MNEIEVRRASSLWPVDRRTFLVATVGTMLRVPFGQAQGQVTQPVLSETDCPLEVITPTAHDGHRGLGVLQTLHGSLRPATSWLSPPIGVAMSIRSLPFHWTIR